MLSLMTLAVPWQPYQRLIRGPTYLSGCVAAGLPLLPVRRAVCRSTTMDCCMLIVSYHTLCSWLIVSAILIGVQDVRQDLGFMHNFCTGLRAYHMTGLPPHGAPRSCNCTSMMPMSYMTGCIWMWPRMYPEARSIGAVCRRERPTDVLL